MEYPKQNENDMEYAEEDDEASTINETPAEHQDTPSPGVGE